MSERLDRFLQAEDWDAIVTSALELGRHADPTDIPALVKALNDEVEARRLGAMLALGSRRDGRIVRPLIRVLRNHQESPRIRGQAAETLALSGSRKALKALIECSIDNSAEVRFWCVFAMGQCRRRRNKTPLAVVRALEARLDDCGTHSDYWTVGLEALAMLQGSSAKQSTRDKFRDTLLRALQDPLTHPDLWQWAADYWDATPFQCSPEVQGLFESAVQTIHQAGFDPVCYGRRSRDADRTRRGDPAGHIWE